MCYFSKHCDESGSVIFFISDNISLTITNTMFHSCYSISGDGGVFYFQGNNCLTRISHCCARNCYCDSQNFGNFLYSYGNNVCLIGLNLTSIYNCSPFDGCGYGTILIQYHFLIFDSINSSNNKALNSPSFNIQYACDCVFSKWTIINCSSTDEGCLIIDIFDKAFSIVQMNFINNYCMGYGLIHVSDNCHIIDSSIFKNIGLLFFEINNVFLHQCYLNHPFSISTSDQPTVISISPLENTFLITLGEIYCSEKPSNNNNLILQLLPYGIALIIGIIVLSILLIYKRIKKERDDMMFSDLLESHIG